MRHWEFVLAAMPRGLTGRLGPLGLGVRKVLASYCAAIPAMAKTLPWTYPVGDVSARAMKWGPANQGIYSHRLRIAGTRNSRPASTAS